MNDMIRVAIVGCGRISDLHAAAYLEHPNAEITAICEPDEAVRNLRGDAWGVAPEHRYATVAELLASADVDMVEVLVPHHLHEEVAAQVMSAGKHLSLQKPMTMSVESATRLIQSAKEAGIVFKVFENFIFYPPIERAKSIIDAGEIGDVLSIHMRSHSGFSPTMWEIPQATAAWRMDPETCGGGPLVFDDGHHKFAVGWYLGGRPTSVQADIGFWQETPIDSPSNVIWRYESGAIGSLEVVYAPDTELQGNYYAQDDTMVITGTRGVIWVRGGHGQLTDESAVSVYVDGVLRHENDMDRDWGTSFVRSGQHFIDALVDGTEPLLTGEQGREVLAITLAAQEAGASGCRVHIDYTFD